MTGKISEDPDRVVTGGEKLAASFSGTNFGILVTSIATFIASLVQTLTNKTIDAASNTILGLTTAAFAAGTLDADGTLSANSDTRIATQKAVKSYADALIAANDAMVFKGAMDCSASPNYPAGNRGDTWRVSVAGKIGGTSGVVVEVGDIFICNTDATASGTQAAVGTSWNVIQTNIDGAVSGPASAVSANLAIFNGTTGKLIDDGGAAISTDGTFAANSDAKVPTEKAVKTFVAASTAGVASLNGKVGAISLTVTKQIFTASGTYTPSANMVRCIIECVGGGGGGGSATLAAAATGQYGGGGGGAGATSRLYASAATIGASQTVTIGAAGAGGAAGSNNGTAGGTTSVGTLCTAPGGSGGSFASVSSFGRGGAGGVAGTGDVAATGAGGGTGPYATTSPSTNSYMQSGFGGSSPFGAGGIGKLDGTGGGGATSGDAATGKGAGGSGGIVQSQNTSNGVLSAAGGNGSAGQVVITEFLIG